MYPGICLCDSWPVKLFVNCSSSKTVCQGWHMTQLTNTREKLWVLKPSRSYFLILSLNWHTLYVLCCVSVWLTVCLADCLSVQLFFLYSNGLSDCLSVQLFTHCLSAKLYVRPTVCLAHCLSVWLTVCLANCLSFQLFVLFVCPTVCLPNCLSDQMPG